LQKNLYYRSSRKIYYEWCKMHRNKKHRFLSNSIWFDIWKLI
jgi:hypothetical protein